MSLSLYNQKRNFKKTGEPEGKAAASKAGLRFVVQKHDASSVHYDFRLEMDGVLKSWAVPKGPSLNPADKRLAVMVEDHPLAYRNFEGVIPAGEYGGGTVIVWDEGTYSLASEERLSAKEAETELLKQWREGKLSFVLNGTKLKGEYTLFQMKGRGEKNWMLVKRKDDWSTSDDITLQEASVKTGKTLADVANDHKTTLNHPAKAAAKKETGKTKTQVAGKKTGKPESNVALNTSATKRNAVAATPQEIAPMLATLIDAPFNDKDWIFETKWDGYRALAYCKGDSVEIVSRNQKPFTKKYAPVTEALASLNIHAVLDGEIVAVDENGHSDFQALQNWQNTPVSLHYYVFDILWLDGTDLTKLPLLERKKRLREVLPRKHDVVRYSDHVKGTGKEYFRLAAEQGLEGIMAKRANSLYEPGLRTADWVKIKVALRQEVVIAGYTEPRRSRKYFGSLLLGVFDGKELVYIGHTGSGFNTKSLGEIYDKLQKIKTTTSPFAKQPKTNMPATWVKPQLVCEIKFTEWTADRMARHPIFMGLRSDKKASEVHIEKSTAMPKTKTLTKTAGKKTAAKKAVAKPRQKKNQAPATGEQLDPDGANEQRLTLNGHELTFTNLQKIYWPKEGFRKGDSLNYYLRMAPFMLPYLIDRPQSLNRHPNGIAGPNFFQKDVRGKVPDWLETFAEYSESTGITVNYLVCSNEATLLYMANLGCIEINPWHARKQHYLKPDWCLIDLDPDKTNTYDQVVEVACTVKKLLDSAGAECYAKTSGSTGMHIYIPLEAKYSFEQSKQLAELVVTCVNKELPGFTSLERTPAKRKGKIYLDFLQNKETQTAAAPYSLRPKPGIPVSTPLHWSEVKPGLTIEKWNAKNIFERVQAEGDLFAPVLGKGIDLKAVLEKLQRIA